MKFFVVLRLFFLCVVTNAAVIGWGKDDASKFWAPTSSRSWISGRDASPSSPFQLPNLELPDLSSIFGTWQSIFQAELAALELTIGEIIKPVFDDTIGNIKIIANDVVGLIGTLQNAFPFP